MVSQPELIVRRKLAQFIPRKVTTVENIGGIVNASIRMRLPYIECLSDESPRFIRFARSPKKVVVFRGNDLTNRLF